MDQCKIKPLIEIMLADGEKDTDGYHSYFMAIMEPSQTDGDKSYKPLGKQMDDDLQLGLLLIVNIYTIKVLLSSHFHFCTNS
jgi:hypothetical protein